jgi:hypothetical protein
MDFDPQELFPAMPPMVQRAQVEGSTGKNSPCGFSASFSAPRVMPGWTVARWAVGSTATTSRRYFVQSITSARFTVCPHWLVPPPRGSTGIPSSRQSASAASTSVIVRGTSTPIGSIW